MKDYESAGIKQCVICDALLESIHVERSDEYPALCKECADEYMTDQFRKGWIE